MSKEKIEVGDWVRLTGDGWAEEYPNAPEYVQINRLTPGKQFYITSPEVGDVGDADGLYSKETNSEFAVEWVPASEVPDEIRFKANSYAHESVAKAREEDTFQLISHNPVSPDHYSYPGGVQVIDLTRHMDFLLGNVVKYVARAGRKGNRLEDLKKAETYLRWAIEDEGAK